MSIRIGLPRKLSFPPPTHRTLTMPGPGSDSRSFILVRCIRVYGSIRINCIAGGILEKVRKSHFEITTTMGVYAY